ncbi:hypothetical protein DFH08DRAFT_955712 [Mycena albidolilacea]|uniref:Uncharacterized protein n=1 Tax=Mycena albidolilacea TaxID=1033008 RepID=A0AAD7ABN9_9AGAR|nr:hypothetical protein DFH08DRAFT_955712 [Mycena albidolilacea]
MAQLLAYHRPSDYLISRCPVCFGGLEHDPSQQVDIEVETPPRMHPQTCFVSEATAQKIDEHVENVRPPKPPKAKQPRVEEEADGYKGEMKVPQSMLNECESSFKATDEKREVASTQFFDDTSLMAILCCHDRVLWLVNMHMSREKQYYVLSLLEMLFQHLPPNIRVGVLYDIACQLHCSCAKFGFLGRYLHRILFVVSVFHAFTHRWACQLIYHPLKCRGFGFTNGEGCERSWHSLSKLIPYLQVAGYHNHLHTINSQIEHADKASLGRLAERDLAEYGIEEDVLREEWKKQVAAQTKPAQKRSKTRGSAVVEEVILACNDPNLTAHVLLYMGSQVEDAEAAWRREQQKLQHLELQLGITNATPIQKLRHSDYYVARMNAKVLKERLRQRLREHKFELDLIERSFRRSRSENQKNDHAGAAIKRREPTISNTVKEYNKLCANIASLIRNKKAPAGTLDVDDAIWQDMGLDEDTVPASWLVDDKVHAGIRAMLQKDRCNEEAPRLKRECRYLQIWFATEWEAVSETMKIAQGAGAVQYQLQLRREELLERCVLWKKSLDSLMYDGDLPPWGPMQEEILNCQISGVTASYGNGQDSDKEGNLDDNERVGPEEEEEEEGGDELLHVSHQTTLHRFFTAVVFAPLRLSRVPHTAPSSNGTLRQMVLTGFFQRAAAVAGAGAGEAKIKNKPPATSTASSSPVVPTPDLEWLLAKRKRDIANMDKMRYTDPDFGDVNWELDQTFGEVSELLESYLDKHEEAKKGTERYLQAYERAQKPIRIE